MLGAVAAEAPAPAATTMAMGERGREEGEGLAAPDTRGSRSPPGWIPRDGGRRQDPGERASVMGARRGPELCSTLDAKGRSSRRSCSSPVLPRRGARHGARAGAVRRQPRCGRRGQTLSRGRVPAAPPRPQGAELEQATREMDRQGRRMKIRLFFLIFPFSFL